MNITLHQLLKRQLLLGLLLLAMPAVLFAQVPISGTFNIPGPQYSSLQAAITDINFNGITSPGVTFNIAANYVETAPAGGYRVTATGLSNAPLVFQKSGVGDNPKFMAPVGIVHMTSTVTTLDGIIRFVGSDYVILDRLDFVDANTSVGGATNSIAEFMDYGVGFFKASAIDGCQNNIIQNCTITLNGMNGSGGAPGGPSLVTNSFNGATGLFFSPTKDTAISAAGVFTINNASGTNSGNKVYTNTFNNCYTGIGFFGNAVSAPYTNADNNNDVGGNIPSTGNTINGFGTTISNYFIANNPYNVGDVFITSTGLVYRVSASSGNSGAAAPTATANPVTSGGLTLYYLYTCVYANGVLVNNQYGFNFSNNTVRNMNGAGTAPALNGLRGLYVGPAPTASATVNNNTFTIVSAGGAVAAVEGINNASGTGTGAISFTNNTINLTQGMAVSPTLGTLSVMPTTAIPLNGITTNTGIATLNITGNTFSTSHSGTAGAMTLIGNSGAVSGTINLSNNNFTGINFTSTSPFTGAVSYISNTSGTSVTPNLNIIGNTFSNISFASTAATGTHIFIYNTGTSSNFQLRKNVWDNITYNASNSIYLIQNTGIVQTSYVVDSNRIQTGFVRTGTSAVFGCLYSSANLTANSVPFQISNNNFSNITSTTLGGSGTFYGIYSAEQHGTTTNHPRKLVYNNVVSNVNYNSSGTFYGMHVDGLGNIGSNGSVIYNDTVSNITWAGAYYGINMGSKISATATTSIYGCLVSNMITSGSGITVYGISATAGTTGTNIYQNKIGGLQVGNLTSAGVLNGIFTNTVGLYNIYNNVIGDLRAPDASSGIALHGINITSGTTVNLSHNNIYLTGTSNTTSNFGSSGIYVVGTSTAVTLQNNIIINTCTAKGTGVAAAFRRTATAMTGYGISSNNNVFYTSATPSGMSPLYFDGVNKDSTLALFKGRVAPREGNSFMENTTLISPSVSSPNFLQPDSTILSVGEGNGMQIAGITTDFNGRIRAGNPGYIGTGTFPDIGAYEQAGQGGDFLPPAITMTDLPNTVMPGDQNFVVRIKDVSGVVGVMLYIKKGINGLFTPINGTQDSGTITNGRWAFNLTAASAGTVSAGDSIYYFVVATDNTGSANTSSYPAGASGTFNNAIPPATTNYYRIQKILQGNFTVGDFGDYLSLTGPNGAFADINAGILSGNITLTIISDVTETGANALNAPAESGVGKYTITIVPDGTTMRTLAGPSASSLITFNGCDRVKIDGRYNGSGRYLTLRNRSIGGVNTIRFINDACRDTVMYTNIESVNQNSTVFFGASTVSGNDSNAVMYCVVSDTAGSTTTSTTPNSVFYSNANLNSENTIAYNEIYNYLFQGINISGATTGHDNWSIIGNYFYQGANGRAKAGTTGMGVTQAIYIQTGSGYKIMNNSIGGSAPDRSGLAYKALQNTTNFVSIKPIELNVGTASVTTVSGNTISNISSVATTANTSAFIGINITGGLVDVLNNTIGGGAMPYDTIMEASYTSGGGIVVSGTATATIDGNTIGNITNYTNVTNASRTTGIYISAGTSVVVKNNTIRDIRSAFTTALTASPTGSAPSGIYASGGAACTIEGNTIYNITNIATSAAPSHAFGITINGSVANTVKRNRIYDISGTGTGTGYSAPGIYGLYITTAGHTISNNQISLGANASGESRIYGIRDTALSSTNTTNSYYYNTVFIDGQTQSGVNNSYAFQRIHAGAAATMVLRNNIFYNNRATSGTGYNYAVGFSTTTNTNVNNIGYNLMIAGDTNRLVEMPAGTGIGVGVFKGMYTTSYNTNWMESAGNIPAWSFFNSPTSGDLGINTTSPLCWYANGKGIAISGVTGDFINATTTRSTTIAGGSNDIGSVEFNTATTPAAAVASGVPASGATTTYTFANRKVAEITWGATGTMPSSVGVTYYSGLQQPNVPAGATRYNGYVNVAPTGGSAYTADVKMIADSAIYGNVTNAAASRLAVYNTPNWVLLSGSASSVNGLLSSGISVTATGLAGDYTGTDQANPLPVRLTAFTATASGKDVVLQWTTQSELNNIGFDIERSIDNINFEPVGFVKGAGNSQKQVRYESLDQAAFANAGANQLYYRLKQLDRDGRYNYSGVAVVTLAANENNMIAVNPNPFVGTTKLVLQSTAAGVANITITDISGKTVLTKTIEVSANTNTFELEELNDLHSGVYFLSSSINGQTQTLKLVKTQ